MEYHMKLSQRMGSISMEKQRSYYNNSIFNTTSLHLTVLRPMEHLKNVEEEHKELQRLAPIVALCILGVQNINSIFHRNHSLFISVWDGNNPSH